MQLTEKEEKNFYTKEFYEDIGREALESANIIVPLILNLVPCEKVVDVGCGNGAWLKIFKDYGVKTILAIDGDYVDETTLLIPKEDFMSFNLREPLKIPEKFDLVLSLEVAEHLPPECAETFVESLTKLGSVILFSAAIPYQGGENHINEQWPDYWINLFKAKNYVAVDCIRKRIWNNQSVAYWYKQNLFMFVRKNVLEINYKLKKELETADNAFSPIVHPDIYIDAKIELLKLQEALNVQKTSLKWNLKLLLSLIKRSLKKFFERLETMLLLH